MRDMKNTTKHRNGWLLALLAVAAVAVIPAGATAKSSTGLTSFHGTVASASTATKTLRITRPNGSTFTFRITTATVFERLGGGLGALRKGRSIEVKARKADGRWTARKVEPAEAEHAAGDDNGGGADDGANHDAGDDHGSGGHGADD
jgi:hypothetical protein